MKVIYTLLIIFILLTGCSKKEGIQFCEGLDTTGKGVTCGKKFTTGELTAVIEYKGIFETDSLSVKVINLSGPSEVIENTIRIEVDRERSTAGFNLPLYNEGKYRIEAYRENELIAQGTIEVADTY